MVSPERAGELPIPARELGFKPQQAVRWLSPSELARTAVATVLAEIFGVYADKREQQDGPSFNQGTFVHDGDEFWLDYVADVGDGFDATYTVASLLAASDLSVDGRTLPRGEVLVMGGDEVYPSASTDAYEQRTTRLYRAALPKGTPNPPTLYAIPGNHDWYDGLTAFLRVFAQGEDIGGWRTAQRRSYFALQLPHRWWLMAIDIQLDTYIDEPQLAYFRQVASQLREGDAIVLCTARPSWYDVAEGLGSSSFRRLEYFVKNIIHGTGANVRLVLTGDAHHYARYTEPQTGQTLLTCGVGGAYTSATHELTEAIELGPRLSWGAVPAPVAAPAPAEPAGGYVVTESKPQPEPAPVDDGPPVRYERADATWPPRKVSRRLAWGVLRLPFRNPGFWALTGAAQAAFLIAMLSENFLGIMICGAVIGGGAIAFTERIPGGWSRRLWFGVPHAAAQVALGVGACSLWGRLTADWPRIAALLASIPVSVLVTGLFAAEIVAVYLLIAGWRRAHLNELFAAQSIEDYKGFARLHIGPDGLTVYPVVVERANRTWRKGAPGGPLLMPGLPLAPVFAEEPFTIPRNPGETF
jgi:hypothetical protein